MKEETPETRARRLRLERHLIFLKAARLTSSTKKEIGCVAATGFIRKNAEGLFLYTCWHVVTGISVDEIGVPLNFPERRQIRLEIQESIQETASIEKLVVAKV